MILIKSKFFVFKKMLGCLTKNGKKNKAYKIMCRVLILLKLEYPTQDPLLFLSSVFLKMVPLAEIKKKRIAGKLYQIPAPLTEARGFTIGLHYFMQSVLKRHERDISVRIVNELVDFLANKGNTFKVLSDMRELIRVNRTYVKYLKI